MSKGTFEPHMGGHSKCVSCLKLLTDAIDEFSKEIVMHRPYCTNKECVRYGLVTVMFYTDD